MVEAIVERATRYVTEPPDGADPVISLASPAELVEIFEGSVGLALTDSAPAATDPEILAAVDQVVEYSMHTSHPRFVNQNFAGPDPIAVVGDWLGAALNTTGATFEVAPVFTMMETAVLAKLGRLAGFLEDADDPLPALPPGLFCAGGSMGTLFALQLARHRHQPDVTSAGANGDRLAVFVSEAGHYAAGKSAALMGLGTDAVVKVSSDHDGAMILSELERAIDRAETAGMVPLAVIGTAGTTVTAAFDDLEALAGVCERRELWLHVDGCYGGSALFSASQAWRLRGVERADSLVWNLHKMMGMTQQCTALLVREPDRLAACFSAGADYLFQSDKLHGEYDAGDRTFQCARRIDVLKLWLTWKARGDAGFAARIEHAVAMAEHTRRRLAGSGGAFVPMVSGDFTNVVFAWVPPHLRPLTLDAPDEIPNHVRRELHQLAPRIKARMQADGSGMIGYQPVHGLNTFRMICMSPMLQAADVDAILAAIDAAGSDLVGA
ncbi:MAG: hypothetical protein DHS20C19_08590 [Acidimicrobiales bacterium]|nr:MAG: hypothetical protein DHS20C19_08590 [Acidimicrobiales bacterium]